MKLHYCSHLEKILATPMDSDHLTDDEYYIFGVLISARKRTC